METWNSNVKAGIKRDRSTTASGVDAVMLRGLFLNWIVTDSLALKTAESESFRAFLHHVNPYANKLLPTSSKTVRRDLAAIIRLRLSLIKKAIAQARSKIHLIYDGWTSTNRMSLFGI